MRTDQLVAVAALVDFQRISDQLQLYINRGVIYLNSLMCVLHIQLSVYVFSWFSWKDPKNYFKKTLKLTGVPTLLRYGTVRTNASNIMIFLFLNNMSRVLGAFRYTHVKSKDLLFQPQKLVEEECLKAELVRMMFTEDWSFLRPAKKHPRWLYSFQQYCIETIYKIHLG